MNKKKNVTEDCELTDLLNDYYCNNCNIRTNGAYSIHYCNNRKECLESIRSLYNTSKKIYYTGGNE